MITLLPYQKEHADNIAASIAQHRVALDASDPGTGKTYVACSVAARLGKPVVIVTTKATAPNWETVAAGFGIKPILVSNYEKVRIGKLPECRRSGNRYVWNVPQDALIIFDECQKCKGRTSLNAKLLIAARAQHLRLLLCSATAASNPLEMRAIGFALGLHTITDFWAWAVRYGVRETPFGMKFTGGEYYLKALHEKIFPSRGSRLRIADIPDFPETVIESAIIDTGKAKDIQRVYDTMRKELKEAEQEQNKAALASLAERMEARWAAMTYVAAALSSLAMLLYYAFILLGRMNNNRD